MKVPLRTIVLSLALAMPSVAAAGDVKLQLTGGRITLQARDVSLREILTEWARVGQVKIVNADRIAGAPVTLDLQGVPENQALTTVLRTVSGYVAVTRTGSAAADVSMYDRIVILATPRATTTSTYTAPNAQPQYPYRGMPPGMGTPQPQILDDQDQPVAPSPGYPAGVPPRMMPGAPQQQPAPAPGQLPTGAPGTVSPMPQTPGAPGTQPGAIQPGAIQPGTGAPGAVTRPPIRPPGGPGGPGGEEGETR